MKPLQNDKRPSVAAEGNVISQCTRLPSDTQQGRATAEDHLVFGSSKQDFLPPIVNIYPAYLTNNTVSHIDDPSVDSGHPESVTKGDHRSSLLNVLSWNVAGLAPKLSNADWLKFIYDFDILFAGNLGS